MIDYNTGQVKWPPTVDQDGNDITAYRVRQEHYKQFSDILESRRDELEDALEARCHKDNEVYRKIGFEPRIGAICYQVGMSVFAMHARPEGIFYDQVGQIQ